MELIADAGGTKTEWLLKHSDTEVLRFCTSGINPAVMDCEFIKEVICQEVLPAIGNNKEKLKKIYFYGAGCTSEYSKVVYAILKDYFYDDAVTVDSDIIGAARALCGNSLGIAAIIGTGSNSCLVDKGKIIQQTPALGYILGDEGGGAVLGRMFLNALLKGRLSDNVVSAFYNEYHLTKSEIIENVYNKPMANKFLASFSIFIGKNLDNKELEDLVIENFRCFFHNNIKPYNRPDLPVNIVGSMAYYYEKQLRIAAEVEGFIVGKILKSPLAL